jgi:hypothetical protein
MPTPKPTQTNYLHTALTLARQQFAIPRRTALQILAKHGFHHVTDQNILAAMATLRRYRLDRS